MGLHVLLMVDFRHLLLATAKFVKVLFMLVPPSVVSLLLVLLFIDTPVMIAPRMARLDLEAPVLMAVELFTLPADVIPLHIRILHLLVFRN